MPSFDRYRFAHETNGSGVNRTTGARNSVANQDIASRIQSTDAQATGAYRSWHDGTRERVRVGKMPDGKYGIRVWTSGGVLTHDLTTA